MHIMPQTKTLDHTTEKSKMQTVKCIHACMHFMQGNKTTSRCNVICMHCYLVTLNSEDYIVSMMNDYGA